MNLKFEKIKKEALNFSVESNQSLSIQQTTAMTTSATILLGIVIVFETSASVLNQW